MIYRHIKDSSQLDESLIIRVEQDKSNDVMYFELVSLPDLRVYVNKYYLCCEPLVILITLTCAMNLCVVTYVITDV